MSNLPNVPRENPDRPLGLTAQPGCCADTTAVLPFSSLFLLSLVSYLRSSRLSNQLVQTAASSMRCPKEAACTSAVRSVATSSAAAATTLSTQ